MTRKLVSAEMPFWPAAMTQQMAASYCGLSVDTFAEVCPVKPVIITASKAGKRYLRIRLDEWLMSLDSPTQTKRQGIGAVLRGKREA